MRAGQFHHRVTFERQSRTQDAIGQLPNTWATLCKRLVALEPLGGTEFVTQASEYAEVSMRLRVPFDKDTREIRTDDRVVDERNSPVKRYNIVSIVNAGMRNRELVFALTKFKA
jgi:head-tail adaptor